MKGRNTFAIFAFAGIFFGSLILLAPASLLGGGLSEITEGKLSMSEVKGSLWDGNGILLFKDESQFIALGHYAWRWRASALLRGQMELEVSHGADTSPMTLRISLLNLHAELSNWHATLPAQMLALLSAQLRPYQLSGEIAISTDSLVFSKLGGFGKAELDWKNAGSGLTDIYPLGDYRILIDASGQVFSVGLSTLTGKLQLAGSGKNVPGKGLEFKGTAQAAKGDQYVVLTELLHHMGPEVSPGVFSFGLAPQ